MPNFRKPGPPDESTFDDASLAAVLAGAEVPPDAAAGLRPVADVLAALRARPTGGELAGEAAATAEFRRRVGVSVHPPRPRRRRPFVLTSLLTRAAAAAAVAAVSVGGVAAAAFTGHLPDPAQRVAHAILGAPDVRHAASPAAAAHDLDGHSAFGLCTAFKHALEHGDVAQQSAVRRRLDKAAGGAGNVAAFCAAVPHPGASSSRPAPSHPAHPTPAHATPSHPAHPTPSHPAHPTPSHPGEPASTR